MEKLLAINVNAQLRYEPETGFFFWKLKKGCRAAGQVAGSLSPRGYVSIFICGRRYSAHRLAFVAMTGELPRGVVDHINGSPNDNRWANLRDVSQSENMENRRLLPQRNSKTGLIGASPHANGGYVAQITRNGEHRYLGHFPTAHAAHAAYLEACND